MSTFSTGKIRTIWSESQLFIFWKKLWETSQQLKQMWSSLLCCLCSEVWKNVLWNNSSTNFCSWLFVWHNHRWPLLFLSFKFWTNIWFSFHQYCGKGELYAGGKSDVLLLPFQNIFWLWAGGVFFMGKIDVLNL